MLLHGAIIFGDLIEGRCNAYFHRANLRSAKLAFFRHSQVRIICRLDLILVLPIAFRKLLNDLIDLGSRKSDGRSGQELNFLADPEFVRRHLVSQRILCERSPVASAPLASPLPPRHRGLVRSPPTASEACSAARP